MYCRNCGKEIEDSKFCPYCGEKSGVKTYYEENVFEKKKILPGKTLIRIAFSILIFCFFSPIIQLSWLGMDIMSLSLSDLFVGIEYGGETQELIPGTVIFLILPLIGFVYSFINSKKGTHHGEVSAIIGGICGMGVLLVLCITKMRFSNSDAIGMLKFLFPFYLYLIITVVIVVHGVKLDCLGKRKEAIQTGGNVDESYIRNKSLRTIAVGIFIGICVVLKICF